MGEAVACWEKVVGRGDFVCDEMKRKVRDEAKVESSRSFHLMCSKILCPYSYIGFHAARGSF